MKTLAVSLIAPLCLVISLSDAKAHSHRRAEYEESVKSPQRHARNLRTVRKSSRSRHAARSRHHYAANSDTGVGTSDARSYRHYAGSAGARPTQWCGWWMRTLLGGGPELNLAWNWRNYGQPSSPQVGSVVVWRHHVGIITGRAGNGQWVVKSGNDGGRVRERPRSVAGAVFRIGGLAEPIDESARRRLIS